MFNIRFLFLFASLLLIAKSVVNPFPENETGIFAASQLIIEPVVGSKQLSGRNKTHRRDQPISL